MIARACCVLIALLFASGAAAADFGTRDGPEPANIDEISDFLQRDRYDMELLISFGTSKGGSAGHIALAIRTPAAVMKRSTRLTFTPTERPSTRRASTTTTS